MGRPGDAKKEAERLRRSIDRWRARLAPRLPGVDLHDLDLILWNLLRPPHRRDWLVRRPADGRRQP